MNTSYNTPFSKWIERAMILILVICLSLAGSFSLALAATCTQPSAGPYPPNYTYADSFLNLNGRTCNYWSGENLYQEAYSYGAQKNASGASIPLTQIKSVLVWWEETNGSQCTSPTTVNSGWKYNTFSAVAQSPSHHYICTGTSGHLYPAISTHYFGSSTIKYTSVK